ncbi:hypothetical protein [Tabrizicola sp.]|uniref:hypothetical protein n=1 Tax=Tabrizicola sp. TaxID=2005166 RepID=UPI00273312CB|nr:hypothetical protein [Tabrizicola sp.]MDP3196047.1 hypothetical protein [Tabrizicola sp.]
MNFLKSGVLLIGLVTSSVATAQQIAVIEPKTEQDLETYRSVLQKDGMNISWYMPWSLVGASTKSNLVQLAKDMTIADDIRQVYLQRDRDSTRSIQEGLDGLSPGASLIVSMQAGSKMAKAKIDRALDFSDRSTSIELQSGISAWNNVLNIFSVEYGENPVKFENVVCYVATIRWGINGIIDEELEPFTDNFATYGIPALGENAPRPLCHTVVASGVNNANSNGESYVDPVILSFFLIDGVSGSGIYDGDLLRISGVVYRATPYGDLAVRLESAELLGEEVVLPIDGYGTVEWK